MKAQIDFSKVSFSSKRMPEDLITEASVLFNVHGALEIKNAFPKSLIRAARQEFQQQYLGDHIKRLKRNSSEVGDKRFLTSVQMDQTFNNPKLYASSKVLPLLKTLLGNDCVLHAFGAITALPGADMQHFHSDHPRLFGETDGLETFFPPYAVHLSIPLIDLNEATGTTAVWEGSHRKKMDCNPRQTGQTNEEADEAVDEPLQDASLPYPAAGDCLLIDFRLWHRGTANLSAKPRSLLYMVYSRSWFNDSANYSRHRRLKITNKEFARVPQHLSPLFAQLRI